MLISPTILIPSSALRSRNLGGSFGVQYELLRDALASQNGAAAVTEMSAVQTRETGRRGVLNLDIGM